MLYICCELCSKYVRVDVMAYTYQLLLVFVDEDTMADGGHGGFGLGLVLSGHGRLRLWLLLRCIRRARQLGRGCRRWHGRWWRHGRGWRRWHGRGWRRWHGRWWWHGRGWLRWRGRWRRHGLRWSGLWRCGLWLRWLRTRGLWTPG
uniref:Uncharacterized protein n=1 Tax=Aegilops tauschii subsp. strangulata TaxID=200361 RepID=A0A453BBI2_AEGTS